VEISALESWVFPRLDSLIIPEFPSLFADFRGKAFRLLYRGSRDGFGGRDFHGKCDGRPNTLTVILDAGGNAFGGFTPAAWESPRGHRDKGDETGKSFCSRSATRTGSPRASSRSGRRRGTRQSTASHGAAPASGAGATSSWPTTAT
jgi:hypothetical protein